jgi:hypothetical protein
MNQFFLKNYFMFKSNIFDFTKKISFKFHHIKYSITLCSLDEKILQNFLSFILEIFSNF